MEYINNKTGNLYEWIADGIDCTNARDGQTVVIYRAKEFPTVVYVRDAVEFDSKFTRVLEQE